MGFLHADVANSVAAVSTRNATCSSREIRRHTIYSITGLLRHWVFETLDHTLAFAFVSLRLNILLSTGREDNPLFSQWGMADHGHPSQYFGSLARCRSFWAVSFCFGTLSTMMACVASKILVLEERDPGTPCIVLLPLDVIYLLVSSVWETLVETAWPLLMTTEIRLWSYSRLSFPSFYKRYLETLVDPSLCQVGIQPKLSTWRTLLWGDGCQTGRRRDRIEIGPPSYPRLLFPSLPEHNDPETWSYSTEPWMMITPEIQKPHVDLLRSGVAVA